MLFISHQFPLMTRCLLVDCSSRLPSDSLVIIPLFSHATFTFPFHLIFEPQIFASRAYLLLLVARPFFCFQLSPLHSNLDLNFITWFACNTELNLLNLFMYIFLCSQISSGINWLCSLMVYTDLLSGRIICTELESFLPMLW